MSQPTSPPVEWGEIRRPLQADPDNARNCAALWALDTLERKLGADWLQRAVCLNEDGFPLGLHLLDSHTHALAEALEWALRLEMSESWEGSADFLRDLTKDPRPARILHSRAQLAQASFAARLGWLVSLEPKGTDGAPADLAIAGASGTIIAEVRVLTPSEFGRHQRQAAEDASDWLFWLGLKWDICIGGRLGREPTTTEREEIEDFVEQEAVRAGEGEKPTYSGDGIFLELHGRGGGARAPALTSPPVREDLFDRMVRAIAQKAEKMQGSGAQWLHATVLTGLWAFTEWGRGSLQHKAPVMASALADALGDRCPPGIVLSSAPGLAPDDMEEEVAAGPQGISLRTGIEALRARESLIMPLGLQASDQAGDWLALARAEADWLSWALAKQSLPTIEEILAP